MSRSYKKHPGCALRTKGMKRIANRAVRIYKENIPKGNAYRKIFQSWEICEYSWRVSWERYCESKGIDIHDKDNEVYRTWVRVYRNK